MKFLNRRDVLRTASIGALGSFLPNASFGQDKAEPYGDAVLVDGEPDKPTKGSFTIAVLPDTQNYSEKYPQHYMAQTRWIAEHCKDRNIACVLHLGDVTNRNSTSEWENAVAAMNQLDGHVPYFMVPGNHDYSDKGSCKDRECGFTSAFPVDKFRDLATFGGVYDREPDRMENSYHLFTAGGRDFLSLCLEFGPRRDVVRWANEVVSQHPKRAAILTTHAYVYFDSSRYDWKINGTKQNWNPHSYGVAKATNNDVSDGEELWNGLVAKHENFILTLNGHVLADGLGRLVSQTPAKRDVHQMLVNYQMRPQGGDGWLRLLEFQSDGKTLKVHDYSPTRNQRNESEQNKFVLALSSPI